MQQGIIISKSPVLSFGLPIPAWIAAGLEPEKWSRYTHHPQGYHSQDQNKGNPGPYQGATVLALGRACPFG